MSVHRAVENTVKNTSSSNLGMEKRKSVPTLPYDKAEHTKKCNGTHALFPSFHTFRLDKPIKTLWNTRA